MFSHVSNGATSTRARAYLDDYFRHFVRPDGTLHYRGPEMGKYGVSLTCLGLYYDYSRDASLLLEHSERSTRWSTCFSRRWRRARERDSADAAYGMIAGYHEADINFLTPNVYELDYDRPYLSKRAKLGAGLRDLAGAYLAIGEGTSDERLAARGREIADAAVQIFEDACNGVERSWITKDGVTGLPIIAGDRTFYWEHPYRARPEWYDENRVWSELYFGGAATEETVRRLWNMAGERGHTTLGVFNNRKSMVGFLVWGEIAGLIQHDMIPEALLTFYAQALHAHTRGTWTAIECVDMDRARGAHSPLLPAGTDDRADRAQMASRPRGPDHRDHHARPGPAARTARARSVDRRRRCADPVGPGQLLDRRGSTTERSLRP